MVYTVGSMLCCLVSGYTYISSPFSLGTKIEVVTFGNKPCPVSRGLRKPCASVSRVAGLSPVCGGLIVRGNDETRGVVRRGGVLVISLGSTVFIGRKRGRSGSFLGTVRRSIGNGLGTGGVLKMRFFSRSGVEVGAVVNRASRGYM